jgi:hypothetical protein
MLPLLIGIPGLAIEQCFLEEYFVCNQSGDHPEEAGGRKHGNHP